MNHVRDLGRVVSLLDRKLLGASDDALHERVCNIILSEGIVDRTNTVGRATLLLDAYQPGSNDLYWIGVIQALIIANYHSAHLLLGRFASDMRRPTLRKYGWYLPLIIALLYSSAEPEGSVENTAFTAELPDVIGELLYRYADDPASQNALVPDRRIVSDFSVGLVGYLPQSMTLETFNKRVPMLCRHLSRIQTNSEGTGPIVQEIVGRLQVFAGKFHMSSRLRMLAEGFQKMDERDWVTVT